MSKTSARMFVALALAVASVALAATRHYVLGPELDGPRGPGAWKITLTVQGKLGDANRPLVLYLPRDFRRQHVYRERFRGREMVARVPRRKAGIQRKAAWQPRGPRQVRDFRVAYSFSCVLPLAQPTPGMRQLDTVLDAPPTGPVRSGKIESMEIDLALRQRLRDGMTPLEKVQACYDLVNELDNEAAGDEKTAAETLRDRTGGSAGKSRLLVALCRSAGLHARLITGLVLDPSQPAPPLHYWAEAWVQERWLPMCPTNHHFDSGEFPENYFVWHLADRKIIASKGATFAMSFQTEHIAGGSSTHMDLPPATQQLWHRLALHGLRPTEQTLVKFLLLLPLAALIVAVFRTIIGVPTFGTFSPALLGLAFLDVKSLGWGLAIFILLVLTGWGMRHLLERFHLLQVPRVSALLTLIVGLLILIVVAASNFGIVATQYIRLFPLVILTHLVERFWTVEAEDGAASSFRTLLGTIVVSVAVSLCLAPDAVTAWMFRYPETLGVVLAIQFVLGRYTGYRLAELYRFGDLLPESDSAPVADSGDAQPTDSATDPAEGKRN